MAYTPHGHQIPGTTAEEPRPENIARCGGARMCIKCSNAIADWWKNEAFNLAKDIEEQKPSVAQQLQALTHSQGTMFKVYDSLKASGMTQQQAVDAINRLQNDGIVFREAA